MKILEVPKDHELMKEILYRKEEAVKILNSNMKDMVEMLSNTECFNFKKSAQHVLRR